MSYLPEVRDALRSAAARQAGGSARPRGAPRWRASVSRAMLVSIVLASVALGGFVLANVHVGRGGGVTPGGTAGGAAGVRRAWVLANHRAVRQVLERDRVCFRPIRNSSTRPPKLLRRAPGAEFTSLLGVLRHPAPAGERVSPRRVGRLRIYAQGVYIRYARHGVSDGITYYLIPAARVGEIHRPRSCYARQLSVFRRQIARLPAPRRAGAVAYERRRIRAEQSSRPGVVLVTSGGGVFGAAYIPVSDLRPPDFQEGGGGTNHITETALLLPNSVATVTAHYSTQTYPGRVRRPVTITKHVVDNLVIFVFRGAWDPPTLTFRAPGGAVLSSTARGCRPGGVRSSDRCR